MKFPSEGPMPRHLLNRTHFSTRPGTPDADATSDAVDGSTAQPLCGARDAIASRRPTEVDCLRCLKLLARRGIDPKGHTRG